MPIDAYVGKPGHGKSYGVVQHVIIPSLKQDRLVVTNIPLQVDMLLEDFGGNIHQLPDDWYERPDLGDLAPPGCVLILDEVWRRWPSGLKANQVLHEDKALLAEHRHRVDKNGKSMRIVLVTQGLDQVASFCRTLIEQTYRVVKKTKTSYRVDIYSGAAMGDRPPKSQLQRQSFGTFKSSVHRYYKSATMSQTGDVGDESKADNRGNIWRSPLLWIMVVFIPILVAGGVWGLRVYFAPLLNKDKPPAPAAVSGLVNPSPPDSAPQVKRSTAARAVETVAGMASGPVPSATWRVAGWTGCFESSSSAAIKTCGPADLPHGQGSIPRTSSVVLVSDGGGTRILPMSSCRWIDQGRYVLCDVDGERVTPWTGRGAVTRVVDPEASPAPLSPAEASSERSDLRASAGDNG